MNQHPREKNIVMERLIQVEDKGLVLEMPFNMSSATEQLDIQIKVDTFGEGASVIDLGFKDSDGMRGWSGGTDISFQLGRGVPARSYESPELETESEWAVLLYANEVPQAGCRVTLYLTCHLMAPCRQKDHKYSDYFPNIEKNLQKNFDINTHPGCILNELTRIMD
ncbi:hypothetical protein NQ117_00365 [Paenibacillus sp. SC116]|uniref:hypothetical protein n=1 Tax=Paenibacillus sp. SC116 TaxID=2968986 RepID=UPI00215A135E|nr:hypothetical protein [Paenibacillus sp. SC116]MCR8842126.1 hypothetical protein [Paenibacillus sp. SC116]